MDQKNAELTHYSWHFLNREMGGLREELNKAQESIADLQARGACRDIWESSTEAQMAALKTALGGLDSLRQRDVESICSEVKACNFHQDVQLQRKLGDHHLATQKEFLTMGELHDQQRAKLSQVDGHLQSLSASHSELHGEVRDVASEGRSRSESGQRESALAMQALEALLRKEWTEASTAQHHRREEQMHRLRFDLESCDAARQADIAQLSLDHRAFGVDSQLSVKTVDITAAERLRSSETTERHARFTAHRMLQQEVRGSAETLQKSLGGVAAKLEDSLAQAHADRQEGCAELNATMQRMESELQTRAAEAARYELQLGEIMSLPIIRGALRNIRLVGS